MRAGLVALLGFLEDEPGWAQLLFEALPDGRRALVWERDAMGVLTALLDDGSPQALGEIALAPELTAELVAGGVFAVIRAHVYEAQDTDEPGMLVELAPSLMAFVVAPYLGQSVARAEFAGTPPPESGATVRTSSDKRASTPGPAALEWAASAHPWGTDRSPRGAFSHTGGVGGSPGGGLARRSIVNREDKGVVDK